VLAFRTQQLFAPKRSPLSNKPAQQPFFQRTIFHRLDDARPLPLTNTLSRGQLSAICSPKIGGIEPILFFSRNFYWIGFGV
jgi:hypothetical protein